VHVIKGDLSSVSEVERLGREAIEWSPTGGIDILVSNAGTGKMKDWMDVCSRG
jgi:NAD(P)-dependent dehydrogenase (short-subunit alcohol dehydrogenase family)